MQTDSRIDGLTDRHDEASSRILQFGERSQKKAINIPDVQVSVFLA